MKIASRVLTGLSLFLLTAGLIYLLTAHEWEGGTEILAAGVAFGYLATITRAATRRAERAPAGVAPPVEEAPVEMEHVGPTIWPLAFSLAAVALGLGAAVARVLLIPGAILFVASAVGWFIDIRRQHAHAEAEQASSAEASGSQQHH